MIVLLLGLLSCIGLGSSGLAATSASMIDDPAVRAYIQSITQEHGLDRDELTAIFGQIDAQQSVIDRISKPAERVLEWHEYAPIFLTHKRVRAGVKFAHEHRGLLSEVEEAYGVPAEIITAIIGVETFFGRYMGNDAALPALATLAFRYPPRASFFKQELTEFLLLANEERLNPVEIKGSYAAAMGMPQFISSSYRRYAIDYDQDGRRDLWNSHADIIGSVANYFKEHGWVRGESVAERVYPVGGDYQSLIAKESKPSLTTQQLNQQGVELKHDTAGAKMLMAFKQKHGQEIWAGHNNFYVITRYNHSQLYALAVYQLSQALKDSGA